MTCSRRPYASTNARWGPHDGWCSLLKFTDEKKKRAGHDWDDSVTKVLVNTSWHWLQKILHLLINQPVVADQRNLWFGDVRSLKLSEYHKFSIIPGWSHCSPSLSCLHWHPSMPRGQGPQQEKTTSFEHYWDPFFCYYLTNCVFQQTGFQDGPQLRYYYVLLMFFHFTPHFPFLPESQECIPLARMPSLAASRRTSGTESFKAACVAGIPES